MAVTGHQDLEEEILGMLLEGGGRCLYLVVSMMMISFSCSWSCRNITLEKRQELLPWTDGAL